MGCTGLHCGGCAGGIVLPVGPLAAVYGLVWVAEHIIEVAVVSAACGVLSIVAVVFLMRWGERRDAVRRQVWTVRAEALPPRGSGTPVPITAAGIRHAAADSVSSPVRSGLGFRDLHIHLDGMPDATQAAVIRQALNGRTDQP